MSPRSTTEAAAAGRGGAAAEIDQLIVRIATESPGWGYTRIRGSLYNVGHEIGRNTIKRILAANGIDPAPERGKRMSWETFLGAHWGAIAATDFFSVEVLSARGLIRHLVLFVIDLKTRRIEIAGIVRDPAGAWMAQVARNLTDASAGFHRDSVFLIHDRDPLFTTAFTRVLRSGGVKTARLPARSPNLNAYVERFVRSIKSECLAKVIPQRGASSANRYRVHRALSSGAEPSGTWQSFDRPVRAPKFPVGSD